MGGTLRPTTGARRWRTAITIAHGTEHEPRKPPWTQERGNLAQVSENEMDDSRSP